MKNENRKTIVYIILSIVMLVAVVALFTYAYFDGSINTNNYLELNVTIAEGISAEFTATGQDDITVEVSGEKMLMDGVGAAAGTGETSIDITLESPMNVFCIYDLYWVWDSDTPNEYIRTTGTSEREFTISGTNATASFVETQLPNYGNELKLGSYAIETNNSTTTQNWDFTANFYNVNAIQDAHADKTYKGKIEIRNAECSTASGANTLSDTILAKADGTVRNSNQENGGVYVIKHETVTYNGTTYDAGVRYEGLDPDNYVYFNNNELWRIIGVFEGSTIGLEPGKQYTKIIRNTKLPTNYAWDYDETDYSFENDWTNSTLNTYLNGTYLSDLTDSDKIAEYNGKYSTWYLRGVDYNSYSDGTYDSAKWYLAERITGQAGYRNGTQYGADTETKAAIGLMYPSDYGYGAYGSACDNASRKDLYYYDSGCASVDWLAQDSINNISYEWLISPNPDGSYYAFYVNGSSGGYVGGYGVGGANAVRPVLYLEASVGIDTGEGTKASPYVLK